MNIMNAYILAGGKSSRMGTDKGLMLLNHKLMVEHVIDALKPVVNEIFIVSNNPEYETLGFTVICDLIKDIGPAGGIFTALSHTNSEKIFIVSCDMPFINSDTIKFIFNNSSQHEITIPVNNQTIEPLLGVYSKSCLFKWGKLIENGVNKLQNLVEYFTIRKIRFEQDEFLDTIHFMNVNTKNDFENAIKVNKKMEVCIFAFGQLTDILGMSELKISDVRNTDDLVKKLNQLFPALECMPYSIAVNHKLVQKNINIYNTDMVALLPPFSGG